MPYSINGDSLASSREAIQLQSIMSSSYHGPEAGVNQVVNERRPSSTLSRIPNGTSTKQSAMVVICITYSAALNTWLSGVVIIAIPSITVDLHLPANLVLWYVLAPVLITLTSN